MIILVATSAAAMRMPIPKGHVNRIVMDPKASVPKSLSAPAPLPLPPPSKASSEPPTDSSSREVGEVARAKANQVFEDFYWDKVECQGRGAATFIYKGTSTYPNCRENAQRAS